MFSEKCNLQGLKGIKRLDRVGPYLVIANRRLYEAGETRRYTLINEAELWVHSTHGTQFAAVVFARKHGGKASTPPSRDLADDNSTSERF